MTYTEITILHSEYNEENHTIEIQTEYELLVIDADEIIPGKDIFRVYDCCNTVYVQYWEGDKLERKQIEI